MSTSKEQEITRTISSSKEQLQQRRIEEQQQAINKALDETKNNIRRTTDEARKDIPHYTQVVNDYQEQTINASREIVDNYVESQRKIINSFQSAWLPQLETANRAVTSNWTSRNASEQYARLVSAFADNTIAVTKLINNTIFANLEAFKTSVQNARDNAKEFSRIAVNAARTLEQTSRDTARAAGHDTSSARIYVEREEQQQSRL
jgi:hypothetical protein